MIIRPQLTRQPRQAVVDVGNPICAGLDSVILPYASSYVVTGTLTGAANAAGYGLSSSNSNASYASLTPLCANNGGDFTMLWNGTINGATQNPGFGYFTDIQGYLWYASNFVFSNQLVFGVEVSGTFHDLITPAYTYTSGKPFTIVAAYGTNTAAYLAVDGILLGTVAAPGFARTTSTGQSFIAGSANGSITGAQTTNLAAVFNRGLTLPEALSLSRNPWQIFKAPKRRIWVSVPASFFMPASAGSFALNGQAATLTPDQTLQAAFGSFTLSGQSAGLGNVVLSASTGSFSLNGQNATLAGSTTAYNLLAAAGSFDLTGALSNTDLQTDVPAGSYVMAGQAAALFNSVVLTADVGVFTMTGEDVSFSGTNPVNLVLPCDIGNFSMNGFQMGFLIGTAVTGPLPSWPRQVFVNNYIVQ